MCECVRIQHAACVIYITYLHAKTREIHTLVYARVLTNTQPCKHTYRIKSVRNTRAWCVKRRFCLPSSRSQLTHKHTHMHTHTNTHIYTRAHPCVYTNTYAHLYTYVPNKVCQEDACMVREEEILASQQPI